MAGDRNGASTGSSARIVLGLPCFFVVPLAILASISVTVAVNVAGGCDPVFLLSENFDTVIPPALPLGWSSTTWVTSDSGLPTPPADTPPNAAFVDDPAMISDKRLDSPSIFLSQGGEPVQITSGTISTCRTAWTAACWKSALMEEPHSKTFKHGVFLLAAVIMARSTTVAAIRLLAGKPGRGIQVALSPQP